MAKRATPKRAEMDARRQRVAGAYLRGKTQAEIAAAEGVDQATISRDLAALRAEWQKAALANMDELKARELAKLDELERAYWAEWEKSRETRETAVRDQTTQVGAGSEDGGPRRLRLMQRKEDRLGDPRYLAGVMTCIEKRLKLLGLEAPARVDHSGNLSIGVTGLEGFTDDELDRLDKSYG